MNTAAGHDGATVREAEADKRTRYPDSRFPSRVLPFALEDFGRLGNAALLHLRALARQQAQGLDEGGAEAASSLQLRWACRLSVALQRANAENFRRSLGSAAQRKTKAEGTAAELGG